jgi:hypothetical protein
MPVVNSNSKNKRYLVDQIHARSLERNPLGAPVQRDLAIYLPPNYFENENERYPTVYFLHGYARNNRNLHVYPTLEEHTFFASILATASLKQQVDVTRLPSYKMFDTLIESGKIEPMIFVQPDGSLHLHNKFGLKRPAGEPLTKGSFFVNSPYTGNYEDYIIEIVNYMDNNYRTQADREHRILAGGSMGGYGALSVGFRNLDYFKSIAALSLGNLPSVENLLTLKSNAPIYEIVFGSEMAAKAPERARILVRDILDTIDLIWSKENSLLSSIQRDATGKIISYDTKAAENWNQGNLITLLKQTHKQSPEPMKNVNVYLSCEKNDEYGFSLCVEKIHYHLKTFGVHHHLYLTDDPKAKLSPHSFGIHYNTIPAIQYFLSR